MRRFASLLVKSLIACCLKTAPGDGREMNSKPLNAKVYQSTKVTKVYQSEFYALFYDESIVYVCAIKATQLT